jgi:hypothetical protein
MEAVIFRLLVNTYSIYRHILIDLKYLYPGRPRVRSSSPGKVKNFLFFKSSRPALRSTQPPIQWVPGALSPGIKRPGREAVHSPPTSAEVKKILIYKSTPTRLHGVVLNSLSTGKTLPLPLPYTYVRSDWRGIQQWAERRSPRAP